jgi:hypothetical protein
MLKTKKELGQFFSGKPVATLLAHLSKYKQAKSIIDPMCGVGDMLIACGNKNTASLLGIEVDLMVHDEALKGMRHHSSCLLINEDAFSIETLKRLDRAGYDLVITNPPYVRYQSLPPDCFTSIRNYLSTAVDYFETLKDGEKEDYKILIKNFSGLSDLAVPSWLLCCLLVKPGGRIGMVLPETWLSRDYSAIVKYVLAKWFHIEFIVEDAHSVWFRPAQVKTILLVARRIEQRPLSSWTVENFCHINLYSRAFKRDSLVDVCEDEPEIEFMKLVAQGKSLPGLFDLKEIKIKDFIRDIQFACKEFPWYNKIEPKNDIKPKTELNALSNLRLLIKSKNLPLTTLSSIGVNVSQGLRTGANFFFYLNAERLSADQFLVYPSEDFLQEPFLLKTKYVREVVRKQSDLDEGYSLSNFKAKGIALALQRFVTKDDFEFLFKIDKTFAEVYDVMEAPLDNYVTAAKSHKLPKKFKADYIFNLSAVQPNIREWSTDRPNEAPRFWYMLPQFSRRHAADLFIPRINSSSTITRLNPGGLFLIDANFSTLWIDKDSSWYDDYSLLSLLNSTWCVVTMEECGTVMGGGALKLEATHLKKMPIPELSKDVVAKLSLLGVRLAQDLNDTRDTINEIDTLILQGLGIRDVDGRIEDLHALKCNLLARRTTKNKIVYESIQSV